MKLKMQVTTRSYQVLVRTVELPKLDIQVAVKKAALAFGLDLRDVREVRVCSA